MKMAKTGGYLGPPFATKATSTDRSTPSTVSKAHPSQAIFDFQQELLKVLLLQRSSTQIPSSILSFMRSLDCRTVGSAVLSPTSIPMDYQIHFIFEMLAACAFAQGASARAAAVSFGSTFGQSQVDSAHEGVDCGRMEPSHTHRRASSALCDNLDDEAIEQPFQPGEAESPEERLLPVRPTQESTLRPAGATGAQRHIIAHKISR